MVWWYCAVAHRRSTGLGHLPRATIQADRPCSTATQKAFWLLSTFCCASKTKNKQKSLKNNYCMSILNSTFCSGSLATSLVREHLSPFLGLLSEQSFVLRIQFIFCVPRLHIKGNIVNLQFPLHAFRRKIISGRKDAVAKMRPVTRKESGEVKKHFDQIERPPRRLYRV